MPREITVPELYALLQTPDPTRAVVDVRFPFEIKSGKIKDALMIPLDEIVSAADQLKKYRHVYLVCQSGGRSMLATTQLEIAGLSNVYNVVGGMRMWRENGYPIELQ